MEVLQHTANLIEAEWQRLVDSVDESETIPDSVKSAVGRVGETAEEVRDFVVAVAPQVVASGARVARQAGMPIPEEWADADFAPKADTADDDTADDEVVDGEVLEDTVVEDTVAKEAAAPEAKAKPKAKAKKTKAASAGSKDSTSKAKPSKAKAPTSKSAKTKKN